MSGMRYRLLPLALVALSFSSFGQTQAFDTQLTRDGVQVYDADNAPAQREVPFMGIPFWLGQGFGLGVSVITDPEKQAWMGAGSEGSFGWPGAFGTWWQADPVEDMVMIYLIQNSIPLEPEAASQLATGQRMGGRAALPVFQKLTYAALGKPL